MKTYTGSCSTGTIEISGGELGGGNETECLIRISEAQFDCGSVRRIKDGFEIKIIGEWEVRELAAALHDYFLKNDDGTNWLQP